MDADMREYAERYHAFAKWHQNEAIIEGTHAQERIVYAKERTVYAKERRGNTRERQSVL